jgi:hypothetical protein
VLQHRLGPSVGPTNRLKVLRRELGRQGGLLGKAISKGVPSPMQPRHPSLHRRLLSQVGFDLHGLDPPVSNQRPEDAPGMTIRVMLAAWASLDPLHYGLVVYDNRQITHRAQQ